MKSVVCLMGPTASGKTKLAMELYDTGVFTLISVDSAMVYRGLDIGSSKPTLEELQAYPHYLVDICEPHQPFDVGQFCEKVNKLIKCIHKNGKIPLLVGGTMMYYHALQKGLSRLPGSNEKIRLQIAQEAQQSNWTNMHSQLAKVDPISASKIEPTDPQRISRALEVYRLTNIPLSHWHEQQMPASDYQFINIALMPIETERKVLHQRIAQRFDDMLAQGFIAEVESLRAHPQFCSNFSAFRSVGYRQALEYLSGDVDYDEMKQKAVAATRQLAKRQLTWLRNWPSCQHMDLLQPQLKTKSLDFIRHFTQCV